MNIVKSTIGVVVLATVTAVGYGEGTAVVAGAGREVDGTGAIAQGEIDLSEVWDKRIVNDEPILWSSLGWEHVAEPESGKTVTLQLVPGIGSSQTLASGLKGHRRTYFWTPGEVTEKVYNIRHSVIGGSPLENLNACFSFENCIQEAPSAADVHAAMRSDGVVVLEYLIANDAANWWALIGGPGEGIAAPKGVSSFKITVEGSGCFRFDYTLAGGTWTVKVDGVVVRTMDVAADWTGVEVPVSGALVAHVIEFATELSEGDSAALKNACWVEADDRFGGGQCSAGATDLREGVLVVRRPNDLMPFTWSSTNFTGNALVKDTGFVSIDPQSVASVRVVQVTGEGEDVSQWTTEVAGTEKVLISKKPGEGLVRWHGAKAGVWKAEFAILTGDNQVYTEKRILDLRNYSGSGLMIFVM